MDSLIEFACGLIGNLIVCEGDSKRGGPSAFERAIPVFVAMIFGALVGGIIAVTCAAQIATLSEWMKIIVIFLIPLGCALTTGIAFHLQGRKSAWIALECVFFFLGTGATVFCTLQHCLAKPTDSLPVQVATIPQSET